MGKLTELPNGPFQKGDKVFVEATFDCAYNSGDAAIRTQALNLAPGLGDKTYLVPLSIIHPKEQIADDAAIKVSFILAELIMDVIYVEHANKTSHEYDTKDVVAKIIDACKSSPA